MPYCGVWIWGLCFLAVAGLVSIIPGLAAYFLAKRKKFPIKAIIAALTMAGTFFLMIFGCIVYYEWCASDFYCDRGFGDYFRIPIKYPYQISAIDMLEEGCLDVWPGDGSCILWGITHYAANDLAVVGKTGSSCPDCFEIWFTFNFDTQELGHYYDKEAYIAACKELGFTGEPVLRSIREHYYKD